MNRICSVEHSQVCAFILFYRIDHEFPGIVFLRRYPDDMEQPCNIVKVPGMDYSKVFPEPLMSKGLSPDRQWYLYEEIAPLCLNTTACPKPSVNKPVKKAKVDS